MSDLRLINHGNAMVIVDFSVKEKSILASEKKESGISAIISKFKTSVRSLLNKPIIAKIKKPSKKSPTILIPASDNISMRGAGVRYKKKQYITHSTLPSSLSAIRTFDLPQKTFIVLSVMFMVLGLGLTPVLSLKILVSLVSVLYFADVIFNLAVVLRSMHRPGEITFDQSALDSIDESTLPIYSVLCPLYKEAHIFPQFLEALGKLDYPKDKLDVLLLLEEDDKETIKILDKMTLPFYIRKIIVPKSLPKTKPKACNYGLSFATGEYLVVYDAEDIPEPMQLKKAYLGFQTLPEDIQCLQAKLNYYNPRANMLTKFFTIEYALWFEIMLTGLQSFNSSLPLGGTSNHFRTASLKKLHGWDPFNVTEDADLGVRLFQKGFRTAVIDSLTLEEATSKVPNWIRQRSRWLKGYMQTYLVHTRNYKEFIQKKGLIHYSIFQLTVGGKILFVLINPLMWIITILYFTSYSFAGPLLETIYTPPISYIAVTSWIFGNFLFLYYYMIACGRRKEWDLMKYIFLIPFYWAIMSISGVVALYQLILKPHYWEKTTHGFHFAGKFIDSGQNEGVKIQPIFNPIINFLGYIYRAFNNNVYSLLSLLWTPAYVKSAGTKKHILIFNWRDTKHKYAGGAEVYIQEIAKRWVKEGNKVTIFCGNDYKNIPDEVIDGIDIIRRGGTYSVYLFAALFYIFKFRKAVDLIVDCENGIPFFTPVYSAKPIILLIHHVHQDIFRQFLKFPMRQIAAFLEGKLMPLFYKNKKIVTVSNSSMQEIVRLGIASADRIELIPNGVSTYANVEATKTINPSIVYLGRLKNYKNIDIAIKAFAKVHAVHSEAVLSIVGSGESCPSLKKLAVELGVSENVKFLGKVSERDKVKLLMENWMMVQPSQMEGWGITVIEANACSTPVIASRVNGLVDSVIDGRTGLLVDVKDVDQFAGAMMQLIEDKALRANLSEYAYIWSQNFNWDSSALQFGTLINRSLEEGQLYVPNINFSRS